MLKSIFVKLIVLKKLAEHYIQLTNLKNLRTCLYYATKLEVQETTTFLIVNPTLSFAANTFIVT